MPQILRPHFGPAAANPFYDPTPLNGFEPIIIDLSRRRRLRQRLLLNLRLWLMAGVCIVVALGAAGFFVFLKPPVPVAKVANSDPYFIRAGDSMPSVLPEKNIGVIPEPRLPPIPKEALDPEVAALIPILKTLPVGQDFVPKNELAAGYTPNARAHIAISVDRDTRQSDYNRSVTEAAQAASEGRTESAIKFYSAALKAAPDDRDTAYNLVALLLKKAAFFDGKGDAAEATALYQRALKIWGEDDALSASIRTRLDWISKKPPQLVTPKFPQATASSE